MTCIYSKCQTKGTILISLDTKSRKGIRFLHKEKMTALTKGFGSSLLHQAQEKNKGIDKRKQMGDSGYKSHATKGPLFLLLIISFYIY